MGMEELRTCIHWDFATCCPPRVDSEDFLSIIRNIYLALAMSRTLNVTNQLTLKANNVIHCCGDFFSDTLAFFYPLIADHFRVQWWFVKCPEKFTGKRNLMVITVNPHVFPLLVKYIFVAHPD